MMKRLSNIAMAVRGAMDFFIHPAWAKGFGGPFNGQAGRQRIFAELVSLFDFSMIIETGTYRGTTTEFMAEQSRIPVYSAELDPRPFAFAFMRLIGWRDVHLFRMDSRALIESLGKREDLRGAIPFVYLDAHWNDDFPLGKEINLILRSWPASVVMIDDFQVPGDEGYGFDSYGASATLCITYLEEHAEFRLMPFFPNLPSEDENGSRRGCVVLVAEEESAAVLRRSTKLREEPSIDNGRTRLERIR